MKSEVILAPGDTYNAGFHHVRAVSDPWLLDVLHDVLWELMDIGFHSGERYVYADELAYLLGKPFVFIDEDGGEARFDGKHTWLKNTRNMDLKDRIRKWREVSKR